MSDFQADTAVEQIAPGRYVANLSKEWALWGPNGGYVSAIALRAAGVEAPELRPASYACQYLAFARFDAVELTVTSLRRGKRCKLVAEGSSQLLCRPRPEQFR